MRMKNKLSFWVTNMSNRNVSLADLNLTIKSFSSVNLLDNKHYSYNVEQLIKSATTGSLFNKKRIIAIRKIAPPEVIKETIPYVESALIPDRTRSIMVIKEEKYEELEAFYDSFSDNDEAEEKNTAINNTKK